MARNINILTSDLNTLIDVLRDIREKEGNLKICYYRGDQSCPISSVNIYAAAMKTKAVQLS